MKIRTLSMTPIVKINYPHVQSKLLGIKHDMLTYPPSDSNPKIQSLQLLYLCLHTSSGKPLFLVLLHLDFFMSDFKLEEILLRINY